MKKMNSLYTLSLAMAFLLPAIAFSQENPPPPPPPPYPDPFVEEEIFKIVETNPLFPGCEDIEDNLERAKCAEEKMHDFMYQNLQYPAFALEKGTEGMVVVSFVVEKDGSISNASVLREIGAGCGDEAVRIVESMPKWNPGKQRGRPVRVRYNLPFRFKIPPSPSKKELKRQRKKG